MHPRIASVAHAAQIVLLAGTFAAFVLSARLASAQGNYRSIPTGGRSALMGGTGVALARDGSAPFLNPATIVRIGDAQVALSVNFYSLTFTTLRSWHQPAANDPSTFGTFSLPSTTRNEMAVESLPSTFCFFLTLSGRDLEKDDDRDIGRKRKLAICVGEPERDELAFTASSYRSTVGPRLAHQSQSILRRWVRTHVGPTLAIELGENVSLGMSLHGILTRYETSWSSNAVTVADRAVSSTFLRAGDGTSLDFGAILGATFRANKRVTFGVSASTPTLNVYGRYDLSTHDQHDGPLARTASTAGTGSFTVRSPLALGAGVGVELERLRFELAGSLHFGLKEALLAQIDVHEIELRNGTATATSTTRTLRESARPVANGAIGLEWFARPTLSVLAGFGTDLSSASSLSGGWGVDRLLQSRQHRLTGTLGLGSYGEGGELLVGGVFSYGYGEILAVNSYVLPNQFATVEQRVATFMAVLAGSTSLRTLVRAVEQVKEGVLGLSGSSPKAAR